MRGDERGKERKRHSVIPPVGEWKRWEERGARGREVGEAEREAAR